MIGGIQIADFITKDDLGEPYDRLADFLSLDDIIRLEQAYGGRQVKFRRNCTDVKEEYPELVVVLDYNKAHRVVKVLGGMWIYFPELRRSCHEKIKSMIKSEFNGYNYLHLAGKYGYTERHIRNIVERNGKKLVYDQNQLSLFDSPCEMFNPYHI